MAGAHAIPSLKKSAQKVGLNQSMQYDNVCRDNLSGICRCRNSQQALQSDVLHSNASNLERTIICRAPIIIQQTKSL